MIPFKWIIAGVAGVLFVGSGVGVATAAVVTSGDNDDDDDDNEDVKFLFPVPWNDRNNIGIGIDYGNTRMPSNRSQFRFHRGIDIHGKEGVDCVAGAAGDVVFAGWLNDAYGNTVIVKSTIDGVDWYNVYAHLSVIRVKVDEEVSEGEVVGDVGSTGNSAGSHVHWEVRKGKNERGSTVDPTKYIKNPPTPFWFSGAIRRE